MVVATPDREPTRYKTFRPLPRCKSGTLRVVDYADVPARGWSMRWLDYYWRSDWTLRNHWWLVLNFKRHLGRVFQRCAAIAAKVETHALPRALTRHSKRAYPPLVNAYLPFRIRRSRRAKHGTSASPMYLCILDDIGGFGRLPAMRPDPRIGDYTAKWLLTAFNGDGQFPETPFPRVIGKPVPPRPPTRHRRADCRLQ